MRFDTKALLKLMKQSWRGGGVKIQRTEYRGLWDSFFITGAGWALLIPKENCPGADDRAAAFPLDAFAVVQAGANLGFLDTEAGIACWKDEDTHGLFWLCDNAGNVPQDVLDAVKHFTPQKH